ncbi:sugar phosphate isomerase/epimerase family protein [Rhizobium sp. CF142]|uniref:sugar phosphate isomerase/epimerase family protein n=1 Tax=Rhizobium sp. CF142 TaxID=1144314 RepID=UPI000688D13C|nr:sugar phosphate isomerase/epimerase [Rhizobium sp. CF142]
MSELAALSYTNVEPYDDLYADPEAFAALLIGNSLTAISGHFSLAVLEADPEKAISIAQVLGMSIIVAPWLDPKDRPMDASGWKALSRRLSAVSARLADSGLLFAWHNHDFEFVALPDGSYPIEHMFEGNDVGFEIDVAWLIQAGEDPVAWMTRYSDRIVAVHIKDIAPQGENLDQDGWTDIGKGVIDWNALWPVVSSTAARLTVIEHDNPADWLGFARDSAATVRRIASA